MVLIALRKEHRRYALRMCWTLERRGCSTRIATDVQTLLLGERELSPAVIILDAELSEPKTPDLLANLQDRPDGGKAKIVVLGASVDLEAEIRDRWPQIDIVV